MRPSACYITAEFAPYVKVGGLGDVSAALASILHGRGHDIRPFLPLYDDLDRKGLAIEPIAPLADLEIAMGPHRYRYSLLRGGTNIAIMFSCRRPHSSMLWRATSAMALIGGGADSSMRLICCCRPSCWCMKVSTLFSR